MKSTDTLVVGICALQLVNTYTCAKQKYSIASNDDGQCIQVHGEGKQTANTS